MNMNDDNFFDDMQDDIQGNDIGVTGSYQDDKSRKAKLVLTVAISFVIGLILLGIVLLFLSGDKEEDMVAINSLQSGIAQSSNVRSQSMNTEIVKINSNDSINQVANLPPVASDEITEKKPVIKKIAKPAIVKKKKTPNVKMKTVKKSPVELKPVLKGVWKVQLMSAQDRDNNPSDLKSRMIEVWNKLVLENPVLKGHVHDIEQTDIKGVKWYRLRVIGLKNSAEATNLCADLKSNNVACVIVK